MCIVLSLPYYIFADVDLQKWAKVSSNQVEVATVEFDRAIYNETIEDGSKDDKEASVSLLKK